MKLGLVIRILALAGNHIDFHPFVGISEPNGTPLTFNEQVQEVGTHLGLPGSPEIFDAIELHRRAQQLTPLRWYATQSSISSLSSERLPIFRRS